MIDGASHQNARHPRKRKRNWLEEIFDVFD